MGWVRLVVLFLFVDFIEKKKSLKKGFFCCEGIWKIIDVIIFSYVEAEAGLERSGVV